VSNLKLPAGSQHAAPTIGRLPRLLVSPDGYLRLAAAEFSRVPLVHLLTGLAETPPGSCRPRSCETTICGYTEWISHGEPAVTLSWDWVLIGQRGRAWCRRNGAPYSNVMLVDEQRADLGAERTGVLLGAALDTRGWQPRVIEGLSERYGGGTCKV
jgi:Domain of unknown function (DUF4902)